MYKPAFGQFNPDTYCCDRGFNLRTCIRLRGGWKIGAKVHLVFDFRYGIAQRRMGDGDRCTFEVT